MPSAITVHAHTGAAQLPGGEPASLQQRPGLGHDDLRAAADAGAGVDRRQRGPDPAGGESAGVADGADGGIRPGSARPRAAPIRSHIARSSSQIACASSRRASASGSPPYAATASARRSIRRSAQCRLTAVGRVAPSERHRASRTRRAGRSCRGGVHRERHAHRRRDPDQRRTTHPERRDRLADGVHRVELEVALLARQQRLVEQTDRRRRATSEMGLGSGMGTR